MKEITKFVRPREGALLRDPKTKKLLPNNGFYVPWTGALGRYWRRRVNCGDVIITEEIISNEKKSKK